jgi:Abnormal spindle-like microcephaly-assoc'd, ASPM-SPD-2-Hydin
VSHRLRAILGLAAGLLATMALPAGASAVTGPATNAFPITTIGAPSTATLTFASQSSPAEPVQSVAVLGAQNGLFQVTDDRCSGQAVAGTCDVTVAFAPTSVGPAAATLRVVGNAGTQDVALTGTGSTTGPKLVVSPATVDFGTVYLGSAATRTVTVTNAADVPMGIAAVGVSAQTGAFAVDADGCGAHTLAPGAGCQIALRFTPTTAAAYGSYSGSLRIDVKGAAPTDVALNGLALVAGAAPKLLAPPMFGPAAWTAFKLRSVTGRHNRIVIKLFTSLPANLRLTVVRKGRVVARNARVLRLGATTLQWRGFRTGRYVVKAEARRMAEVRRDSRPVTVTK